MNHGLLSNGWLLMNDQNSALGSTTEDRFQEVSGSLARKLATTRFAQLVVGHSSFSAKEDSAKQRQVAASL